jgi:hypothetical protein
VNANQLPGPSTASARPPAGTFALLVSPQPRGMPFAVPGALGSLLGKTVFARSIQPDPDSPFRVGISLTNGPPRPVSGAAGLFTPSLTLRPDRLTLCVSELRPLAGIASFNCVQPADPGSFFPPGQPVTVAGFSNEQLVRLYGIAADSVREIDLYLASGRVIPAALRDNAYTVEAPSAQLPGKLVAYDAERHPIWVHVPNRVTPPILTPCPPATIARTTSPPKPHERLDLATAEINGNPILGRSPAEVEAALGPPDWRRPKTITPTTRDYALGYGNKQLSDAPLVVGFVRRQHRLRAVHLEYRGSGLVDARLGHVLQVQPPELERRVAATYGSTYRRVVAYGSELGGLGCGAEFQARHGLVELSFGLQPEASSQPYVTLRRRY